MSAPVHSPYQLATFTSRRHESEVTILTVHGELDFTTVDELIDAATRVADDTSRVILDLSGVEYFGSAGFSALHTLNERFTARATSWAVVPSRNVARVVRICDTGSVVPLRASLPAALASA